MEALPEELRNAIVLREIEGLSYEEIAEEMNCPIGTVRSRIFRVSRGCRGEAETVAGHVSGPPMVNRALKILS